LFTNVKGTKAISIVYDHNDPQLVHDIQWFADKETFYSHADMTKPEVNKIVMGFMSLYDMSRPFTGEIYGDWDEKVIEMTKGFKAEFSPVTSAGGFIRQTGNGFTGPPVIVASCRMVKEGCMDDYILKQQAIADYWYDNTPHVIAATHGKNPNVPNQVFDLQVFANKDGFMAHMDPKPENMDKVMAWVGLAD